MNKYLIYQVGIRTTDKRRGGIGIGSQVKSHCHVYKSGWPL